MNAACVGLWYLLNEAPHYLVPSIEWGHQRRSSSIHVGQGTNASDALRKLPSSYHTFMNTGQEVSYSSSVGVIFYGSIKGTTRTKDTCGIVVAPASSSDQTSPTDLGYRLRRGRAHS